MMIFFYQLAMHIYGFFLSIRILYRKKKFSKIYEIWHPKLPHYTKPVVWVHAVSLGEVRAMHSIIEKLNNLNYQIVVSTITETGLNEAKKRYPFASSFLFPLDIGYIIKPLLKKVSPELVLLSETDFWPCFLKNAKKVCVVNAKISERSYSRWKKFSFFKNWINQSVDHFCVQDQIYYQRFLSLGIDPKKMTLAGNLKIDQLPIPLSLEKREEKRKELGCVDKFVVTLGSTHSPEEKLFLHALSQENIRCFIVPRHPERFKSVELMLQKAKLSYSLFSEKKFNTSWILVDQMGILNSLYQISDLAFVGGTLTKKIGGHNLLEPISCETPLIHGPFLHSQPTLATLLKKYAASHLLDPKKITADLQKVLKSPILQKQLVENGKKLLFSSKGALEKNWNIIISLLQEKRAGDRL